MFSPSFTGERGGSPCYMPSPDINIEDFPAAVDFISTQGCEDAERIGVWGICGWEGIAILAAALDPRIKVTVTSTMYDMGKIENVTSNDLKNFFGSDEAIVELCLGK